MFPCSQTFNQMKILVLLQLVIITKTSLVTSQQMSKKEDVPRPKRKFYLEPAAVE